MLVSEGSAFETWCNHEVHIRFQGKRFGRNGSPLADIKAHVTLKPCRCGEVAHIRP